MLDRRITPGQIMYMPASLVFGHGNDLSTAKTYKAEIIAVYPTYVLFEVTLNNGMIKRGIQIGDLSKCSFQK